MARKPTSGRFDTRAELCEAIWSEWFHSPRNMTDIARFCRVSATTVANIMNTKEGLPMADKRSFENTRQALIEYDAGKPARDTAWNRVETNDDVTACENADKLALRKVQQAFHKDTSDINSLDHCYLADMDFMRRMARGE